MNKQIKNSFLSGLVFSGTILLSYIGFAAFTSLPTQNSGDTLNSTIWNNLVNTVNDIGTRTDGITSHSTGISLNPNGNVQIDMKTNGGISIYGGDTLQKGINIGTNITNRYTWGQGTAASDYPFWLYHDHTSAGGGAGFIMYIDKTGNVGIGRTPAYPLDVNGQVRATNIAVSSDIRFKKNVTPIFTGIDTINKLNGVTYYWKDVNQDSNMQYGFIAQEVENILPDLVKTDINGYKSVNYIGIIPILVKSIQEQNIELNQLKKENEEIKIRLDELE